MKRAAVFSFFIIVFILAGCTEVVKKDNQPGTTSGLIEPQSVSKFGDIPVPSGFKLLPQNSYSFENSGIRVGLLKYQGKGDPEQLINFYKEQMVMYNWRLLNIVEFGERMLNFDRDQETCIITIQPKGGKNLLITVAVGPKAQSGKKEGKLIK